MHTYKLANRIADGPITTLLSVLCIWVEVLSRAHANRGQRVNDLSLGTSIGRFPRYGAASTAVKGLKYIIIIIIIMNT